MTEAEARAWIIDQFGPAKLDQLERYVGLLLAANEHQNLISKATERSVWVRHILDSAQLVRFAPDATRWLDVGSGAGLPGLVIAILTGRAMLLVEPRRKRVEFLQDCIAQMELPTVQVRQASIERVRGGACDAVTARAYASLPQIFSSTVPLTDSSTIWILPKGRTAAEELEAARQAWQGVFHVEQSLTDADSRIIVATGVRPR